MENSHRFFANKDCKYYPCHKGIKEMNCLFCFCPFYVRNDCPGHPNYVKSKSGGWVKDCTNCIFPHRPENYDVIMQWLREHKVSPDKPE